MNADIILGFFVGKGLLIDPSVKPCSSAKLDIKHVLLAADEVEPRILEVLPAALLHFPRSFKNKKLLPLEFQEILKAIKRGEDLTNTYKGIRYRDMKRWADRQLRDKRTKPISQKRVKRGYRLTPETLKMLRTLSTNESTSDTEVLEGLVRKAYKQIAN